MEPTKRLTSRSLEGHLPISTGKKWSSQLDGQVRGANRMKQGKRLKHTYREPIGSPPVGSKGEGSRPQPKQPQPESQPEPAQPENLEEEEERPWVHKPFVVVIASYRQVKDQYLILERTLESISFHLDVEPQ